MVNYNMAPKIEFRNNGTGVSGIPFTSRVDFRWTLKNNILTVSHHNNYSILDSATYHATFKKENNSLEIYEQGRAVVFYLGK